MKFNAYINSHFTGCRLLAEGYDACRSRPVRVFLLPGYHTDVGFTDGTDAWIVPLAAESCTGNGNLLKGVNLRELMGRILNGENPAVVRTGEVNRSASRRRVLEDDEPAPVHVARRRVAVDEEQPKRRRLASV